LGVIVFHFPDQCDACDRIGGPSKDSFLQMYCSFINDKLLPEITSLADKYSVWWSFKPESALKQYLNNREIELNEYFCPEELLSMIATILISKNTQIDDNKQIINLDEELQTIFDTWIIFLPNLKEYVTPHINVAPPNVIQQLQNENMNEEFYMESPKEILYKDTSSVFWLNPVIDFMLNKSTGNIYSWPHLVLLFTDFCLNNTVFFTRQDEYIISVNPNTPIAKLFHFKYFHIDQCEQILKQITKFLGRKNSILHACPFLRFSPYFTSLVFNNQYENVATFVDDIINNNHSLLPEFNVYFYL
jgi:hypothetical protein